MSADEETEKRFDCVYTVKSLFHEPASMKNTFPKRGDFEASLIHSCTEGDHIHLTTTGGTISASAVIISTKVWASQLIPVLKKVIIPIREQMLAYEPMPQIFPLGMSGIVITDEYMRVRVSEENAYYFPDVAVSCDVADRRRGNKIIRSPRIVVEVLSPSTEKFDRTDKMKKYQSYSTIQEIVLINQFAQHIEIFRRGEDEGASWSHTTYGPGKEVALNSLDIRIPIEEIYQDIDFDEPLLEE